MLKDYAFARAELRFCDVADVVYVAPCLVQPGP